ncbi:MAG: hypothetical protein JWP14_957 [Frankiales bacterium]|nr:hypothetical protein [Frankiales bacterium]
MRLALVITTAAFTVLTLFTALGSAAPASASTWPARHLDDRDNHAVVSVHRGQTIVLTLASTYWTIGAPSGTALSTLDGERKTPNRTKPGCRGGSGCGTDVRDFKAVRTGTSGISATRSTCGEALRCPAGKTRFYVTVHVIP